VATYLDRILAAHRAAAAVDPRPLTVLIGEAESRPRPPSRGFGASLSARPGTMAVIAEIKRRSPSKGDLAADLVPEVQAKAYESGGATCLSVLTDREFFGGSPEDLIAAREATNLPVLRKDFTVGPADVCDAALMGADAVLLITAALSPGLLGELDALIEVHDEAEVALAMAAGATLIGVNQRDLVTFEVDTDRAVRVAASIPPGVIRVAESGIRGAGDVARLAEAGYDAVLVGELLVRSGDPAAAVAALRGA
jgi:indole-3-glycerol phosphate synthase